MTFVGWLMSLFGRAPREQLVTWTQHDNPEADRGQYLWDKRAMVEAVWRYHYKATDPCTVDLHALGLWRKPREEARGPLFPLAPDVTAACRRVGFEELVYAALSYLYEERGLDILADYARDQPTRPNTSADATLDWSFIQSFYAAHHAAAEKESGERWARNVEYVRRTGVEVYGDTPERTRALYALGPIDARKLALRPLAQDLAPPLNPRPWWRFWSAS